MKKRITTICAVFITLLTIGATEKSCDEAINKEKELNQAILDLKNPSKIMRRQAAEKILLLVKTPGIERAIDPLADVLLEKDKPSGIFTQAICANALGKIADTLGSPAGDKALDALLQSLRTDRFDYVRAASASALRLSKNASAIEPLEQALSDDKSPLVKQMAKGSLDHLERSGIKNAAKASSGNSVAASSNFDESKNKQKLIKYLKSQILYANPPIDQQGGGL